MSRPPGPAPPAHHSHNHHHAHHSQSHSRRPPRRSTASHDSPASPDVISNLLASFSAISLPPDEPARDARGPLLPVSAPRTPPHSLVPPNPALTPYWSHLHVKTHPLPSRPPPPQPDPFLEPQSPPPPPPPPQPRQPPPRAPHPDHRNNNGYNNNNNDNDDGDDDDLAAEPPTIRTSKSSRSVPFLARAPVQRQPSSSWRSRASFAFKSSEPSPVSSPLPLASPLNEYDPAYLQRVPAASSSIGSSMRPAADAPLHSPAPDLKGKAKARAVSPVPEAQFEDALEMQDPSPQPSPSPHHVLPRDPARPPAPASAPATAPATAPSKPNGQSALRPWRRRRDARRLHRQPSTDETTHIVGDDTGFVVLHSPHPERSDSLAPSRIVSPRDSSAPSRAPSRDGSYVVSRDDVLVPSRRSSLHRHQRSPPSSSSRAAPVRSDRPASPPPPHNLQDPAPAPSSSSTNKLQRTSSAETVNLDAEIGDLPLHPNTSAPPSQPKAPAPKPPAPAAKTRQDHIHMDPEENDVTRRIRELKAANERRRRDLNAADPPQSPRSNTRNLELGQPSTTLASLQLEEAAKIKEQPIMVPEADGRSLHDSRLGVPFLGAPPSLRESRDSATFSRPSHDSVRSGDPMHSPNLNSTGLHTPGLSRASSRVKRWSFTEPSPKADSPARSHRRADSRDLKRPTTDERPRTATNSIQDAVQDFLSSPRLSRTIPAADDFARQIAFSDIGDPHGHAVICCVGMGLTRYITAYYEELAVSLGLRLITPDRPGIGDSSAYHDNTKTPLSWPDDVRAITRYLGISRFSLLAHSAGAVYAMATAIRMPEKIRGRIHLLAPWIPPSQMSLVGLPTSSTTAKSIPRSQRFLRMLPASLLRFGSNSMGRSNVVGNGPASPKRPGSSRKDKRPSELASQVASPRRSTSIRSPGLTAPASVLNSGRPSARGSARASGRNSPDKMFHALDDIVESEYLEAAVFSVDDASSLYRPPSQNKTPAELLSRQQRYDAALTPAVWQLATKNSNPAVDLLVCLERSRQIGFRYADASQSVVIHHGSKDTRVPLENVKWIAGTMRAAEVRVLEGEGHGLMASAGVMSQVLVEMSRDKDLEEGGNVLGIDDLDFR